MQAIQHTLATMQQVLLALIMRRRDIHGHGYVEISKYHMRAAAPLTWADTPVSRGTSRLRCTVARCMNLASREPLHHHGRCWEFWQVEDLNVNVH
jgi:hypothetical protein